MNTRLRTRLVSRPRPLGFSLGRFTSAAAVCAALLAGAAGTHAAPATWDADGLQNGIITSGGGLWDNATPNFTDPTDSLIHFAWNNVTNATDVAAFGGAFGVTPFNITVGTITAAGVQFDTLGYILSSGTLTLNAGTLTANVDGRINSIIAGAGGLTSNGLGTLVLGGANTFTGQLQITSGTVALSGTGLGGIGVGNETVVSSGATLNLGGQSYGNLAPAAVAEIFRIAGTGVGGIGALINQGVGQQNATSKVVLTADATINSGGDIVTSYSSAGQIVTSVGGRMDVRLNAAPTAGQNHLDLAGFTLTKKGSNLLALVNASVSDGNIIVDEGQLNFEAGTLVQGLGTVTVNSGGKLGFWSIANAANISRQIVVNGGTIGDPTATGATQTVGAPIQFVGALNPNFVAISGNGTTLSGVISQSGFTGTALDKRGAGLLGFSNPANTFSAPINIFAGTLRASFTTALGAGGVPAAAPLTTTNTPLGTSTALTLSGGTLDLRINLADDATNQFWSYPVNITVDRAPGAMVFDRLSNANQTNKFVTIGSLNIAPASAANQYAIGQNQFTFTQGNTHRLDIPSLTMNSDTVLATGDHNFSGSILSAGKNSLLRSGGNTTQFLTTAAQQFNAFFEIAGNLRVGSGFGTPTVNNAATVGSGPIFQAPATLSTFRSATNLAPGQIVELLSQRIAIAGANFESNGVAGGAAQVPANLRALTGGLIGIGSGNYGGIDLSKLGDGTFRIAANILGSGNGIIDGGVVPGAGGLVRVGGTGTVTYNGTNAFSGAAGLEVGGALIHNTFQSNSQGTAIVTGENNYTGGTTVNRGSTLNLQNLNTIGTGAAEVFGTLQLSGIAGRLTSGTLNTNAVTPYGGSTVFLDNSAVTSSTPVNRWGDTEPIVLTASTLTYSSPNAAAVSTGETLGVLAFGGGSILNVNRTQTPASGHIAIVNVNTLNRGSSATLDITRNGGTGAGWTGGQRFIVTGGGPTLVNGIVPPYFVMNGVTEGSSFGTYGANGFANFTAYNNIVRGGTPAGTFDTGIVAGTSVAYVDFLGANTTLTLGDNPIVHALKVGGGTAGTTINSSGSFNTITSRSGGLIFSHDGGITTPFSTDGTRTVTFNPAFIANNGSANIEAVIYTRNAFTGVMNGAITANGLTKFGAGTLNLTANNGTTLSGTFSVNQGTVQLFGPTATGTYNVAGNGQILLNGGQLNLRSNNSALTGTINPTLQNSVTLGAGIPTATIDLNRSGADTASSGTFIFNPAVASSPGLQLGGSPGVQGQTLNISGANYALQFGTNALNSLAGNVTINNAVNLTLNNSPSITGTNPVITKSGAGTWIIGSVATPAGTIATPGTRVILNEGTLELRSLTALGTGNTTTFELNRGTLTLRRDSAGTYGGGIASPYAVSVNGSSTILVDRNGAVAATTIGIGPISVRNNSTLTVSNANGYALETPKLDALGTAFISSGVTPGTVSTAFRVNNATGGSIVKTGTGHLHFLSSNSFDGGLYINQGIVRLRGFNSAGTGDVYLNPGATIDFNSTNNMIVGQRLIVRSTTAFPSMISMNQDLLHPTTDVDTTQAAFGIVGLSNGPAGFYNTPIDLSAIYGGGWSLGGVPTSEYDPRYTASSLVAGNGSVYRLGGGGTSFYFGIDSGSTPQDNVLTGPNSVRLGIDSSSILPVNMTNFQYVLAGTNDFTGSTVIHRGMAARLSSAAAGGRSGLSNGTIDIFGTLQLSSDATLVDAGVATNAFTLHPGSALFLDNANNVVGTIVAANVGDRIADSAAINLNGSLINMLGATDAVSTENLGDITYTRGGRLRVARGGTTGTATLTLNSVTRAGAGSSLLLQTSAAGTLGGVDKIISTIAPAITNGMADPSIVNITDGQFVTHGLNGFVNITPDVNIAAAGTLAAGLAPTTKVNVASTGTVTLGDNATIYSLRTDRDIAIGGPFTRLTLRSGGLIGATNALTIQPNLVFNDGTSNIEAKITTSITMNLNGTITANGVTKSGSGALIVNVPNTAYASGWTVNSGDLQFNDLEAAGQSVPGNGIVLNGTPSTGGLNPQNFNGTRVVFQRDYGTAETATFTGGPITVVNEGIIRIATVVNDRNLQIPSVSTVSTGADSRAALTLDVPFNRARGIIPSLTLGSDTLVRVFDSGSTADTGRVVAAVVNSLVGTGRELVKIGNRTLELAGDNSATYTGGSIVVSQGTVRVLDNGSLGSASTAATFERNATLEIGKSNFVSTAPVTQLPGSIERWNVEDARGLGTYNLPADVNLQLNANLIAPRTIGLNGGTIEGFLWIDHPAQAVHRTIDSGVTINLLASSFVGQNILQGQNYDAGRLPTIAQPFANTYTGAILCINGVISGSFDLTKTGNDTVTIAGTANTYNNTIVDMGVLRIGANNALPVGGDLTPRLGGTFDLYGFNQIVNGLGTITGGPNPGGVSVSSSGRIVNSGVTDNTLTVNSSSDYTYNGTIELNVALTKNGAGILTIGSGGNSYRGATTINAGTLSVSTVANGGSNSSIGAASSAAANLVFSGGATLQYTGGNTSTDRAFTLDTGGGKIEVTSAAATLTVDASIIGVGGLTKLGDGTLALAEQNFHFGTTLVSAGTLALADFNALSESTLDTGSVGPQTVTFSALGTGTYNLGGLKGDDDLDVGGGNNSLVVGGNSESTIFNGDITNALFVTKTGSGRLELNGLQNYATLNTFGFAIPGRTDLNNVLGTGTSTINANAPTNITVNQTLAALNIGAGAVVTLGNPPPPAPAFAADGIAGAPIQGVPEPGSAALLLTGALGLLARRRTR